MGCRYLVRPNSPSGAWCCEIRTPSSWGYKFKVKLAEVNIHVGESAGDACSCAVAVGPQELDFPCHKIHIKAEMDHGSFDGLFRSCLLAECSCCGLAWPVTVSASDTDWHLWLCLCLCCGVSSQYVINHYDHSGTIVEPRTLQPMAVGSLIQPMWGPAMSKMARIHCMVQWAINEANSTRRF